MSSAPRGGRRAATKVARMDAQRSKLKMVIRNDSMSITLFGLFLIALVCQGASGWLSYNQRVAVCQITAAGVH